MLAGDPGLWLSEGAQKASQLLGLVLWMGLVVWIASFPIAHKNQKSKSKSKPPT